MGSLPAGGRRRPHREQNLVEWVRLMLKNPWKLTRVMDPRLEGQFSESGALKAAALAYQCLSHPPKLRPPMSEVIIVLEPLKDVDDDIPIGTFVFVSMDSEPQKEVSSNNNTENKVRKENGQQYHQRHNASAAAKSSPKSQRSFREAALRQEMRNGLRSA